MDSFIAAYRREIIWIAIVLGSTVVLRLMAWALFSFVRRRLAARGVQGSTILALLERLTRLFIHVVASILISYVFLPRTVYGFLNDNLLRVIWLFIVVIATLVAASLARLFFERLLAKAEEEGSDPTAFKFLRYASIFAIYVVCISLASYAFPGLRFVATSALAGASILAVVMGIASQEATANIVGGVLIVMFRPFKTGDVVRLEGGLVGTVEDITLRHTVIRDYENKRIVVPNALINKEKLVNYDLGDRLTCAWLEIGVSYDTDIDRARQLMRAECMDHPKLVDARSAEMKANRDPVVVVRVIKLAESAVVLRAWAWAADYASSFVMRCELYESIKLRFDAEDIRIPYPHRTVVLEQAPDPTQADRLAVALPRDASAPGV